MRSDTSSSSVDTTPPGGPFGGPAAPRALDTASAGSIPARGSTTTAANVPASWASGSTTGAGAGAEPWRATIIGQSPQSYGFVDPRAGPESAFLRQHGQRGSASRGAFAPWDPFRPEAPGEPTTQ